MGLPIWRDPTDSETKRDAAKTDPTAAARSSIRRRSSVHGRRASRPFLPRETSRRSTERTLPPASNWGPPRMVRLRRAEHRGVPPVSTLLESADGHSAVPPVAPETRSEETAFSGARFSGRRRRESDDPPWRFAAPPPRSGTPPRIWDEAAFSMRGLDRDAERDAGIIEAFEGIGASGGEHNERQSWLSPGEAQWTRSPSPLGAASTRGQARPSRLLATLTPDVSLNRPAPRPRSLEIVPEPEHGRLTPPHERYVGDHLSAADASRGPRSDILRRSHPLRHSWRAESPVDGLGDRIRSPTPADGWELMRSTIAPDETLPSAESSFASAAASNSFNARGIENDDREGGSSSNSSRRTSEEDEDQSDSVSSIDPDDLICNDEERQATALFARDIFFDDSESADGLARIARHRAAHAEEGNRYALTGEPEFVEIGFRLINEALDTPEGRSRVFQLSHERPGPGPEHENFEQWIFAHRREGRRRTRLAHMQMTDDEDEMPTPRPERYGGNIRDVVRQERTHTNDYFHRRTADSLSGLNSRSAGSRDSSPPPRYERLASVADENAFISQDAPEPHPVGLPSERHQRNTADGFIGDGNDERDLAGVRRIVERLAQREDIPDEWWTSVGLARHLPRSRSRVQSHSPGRRRRLASPDSNRVQAGRVQRWSQSPRL